MLEKLKNFHLFFQILECSFATKNIPEDFKSETLIKLLRQKLSNILSYDSDKDLKSYEKMKIFLLKEYQSTVLKCLIKFRKAQCEPNEIHCFILD